MSFAGDMRRFANLAKKDMNTVLRSVALQSGSSLIYTSPVDTGRFRANWRFEIGAFDPSTDASMDKSGAKTFGRLRAVVKGSEIGDVIYLSNNLPYAIRLEEGWSEQSKDMVKNTASMFQQMVKDALKEIGR